MRRAGANPTDVEITDIINRADNDTGYLDFAVRICQEINWNCQATGTGTGDGDGNPVPGDDSIIFGATHPPPSTTLNHVRDL